MAEGAVARKEAKGKRGAARERTEHVGLVEEQDTSQRGVEGAATKTCTPSMKMRLKTLKEHLTMIEELQAWCSLEDRENEQWQEVISRRDKHKVQTANQTSLSECGEQSKFELKENP